MRKLIEEFLQYYLGERNAEAALALLTDRIISIGTGEHELARGKEELRSLMEEEFKELPEPLQYKIYDYMEVPELDSVCNQFMNVLARVNMGEDVIEMRCRLTSTCVKEGEDWKISCLHMSTPEKTQSDDTFFPLHYRTSTGQSLSAESSVKLMELISDTLPGSIMGGYLEEGYPLYTINDKMLQILGYTYEELLEATGAKMIHTIYAGDRARVQKSIRTQFAKNEEYEIEYRAIGKDNRIIWVRDIGRKIVTEDGREAMLSIMTDITEQVEREERLRKEASHDSLTNLYNRKKAISLIEEELAQNPGGILFVCDIDYFKRINDTRGHLEGDQVLIELALIMKEKAEGKAVFARIGGDEYLLFFPGKISQDDAFETMSSIQQEFFDRMKKQLPELSIALSAGSAVRQEKEQFQELYRVADAALYEEKKRKGTHRKEEIEG